MQVLVVDGANVVGSRPDGWWRDRARAAERLREELLGANLPYDDVVLVLEGRGRGGGPAGQTRKVLTVHAQGSGDDTILEVVQDHRAVGDGRAVVVVTADRALRARVEDAGASVVGPSWLLDRL